MPAESVQIESDPFLQLLTDALRDGPGSPAWHDAVTRLNDKAATGEPVDEYRLLCQAREHLESGKEFRSIRPGPVFTQRVMSAIESDSSARPLWSTRRIVIMVAALCVLIAATLLAWKLVPRGGDEDPDVAALSSMLFGAQHFTLDVDRPPRDETRFIGSLPMKFDHGMLAQKVTHDQTLPIGGGVVLAAPIAAEEPFEIDARIEMDRPNDDLIPEIVISDVDDFSKQMATSSHEFVWALQAQQAKVILPDGRQVAQADCRADGRSEVPIRIRVDQKAVIVEVGGRVMWSGGIGLSPTASRFIAIRMLRRGQKNADDPVVRSFRVLTMH